MIWHLNCPGQEPGSLNLFKGKLFIDFWLAETYSTVNGNVFAAICGK